MENEVKTIRNKDKFFAMREKEQSIEENPIRYGREQFFKGKMAAYDRIEREVNRRKDDLDERDAAQHLNYHNMLQMISLLRKTES